MTFVNPAYPLATPPYIGPTSYLLPNDTAHDSSYLSPRHGSDYPTYRTGISEYEDYMKYRKKDKDEADDHNKGLFGLPKIGELDTGSGLIGLLIGKLLPALLGGGKDGEHGGLLGGLFG